MGDVRDIRSARGAPPPPEGQGMFAALRVDAAGLVGVAHETADGAPMIVLDAPPAGMEGWALTPAQAADLAAALAGAAEYSLKARE